MRTQQFHLAHRKDIERRRELLQQNREGVGVSEGVGFPLKTLQTYSLASTVNPRLQALASRGPQWPHERHLKRQISHRRPSYLQSPTCFYHLSWCMVCVVCSRTLLGRRHGDLSRFMPYRTSMPSRVSYCHM